MNHSFISAGSELCAKCGRDKIDHTDRATCEVCGNSGDMEVMDKNILMCSNCQAIDLATEEIRTAEHNRRAIETKKKFLEIDSALSVQTDIFNAETVAIAELTKTGATDMEVAVALDKRFQIYVGVIFQKRQEIAELETKIRATQTYFNELSRKLREDERAKLKLKDSTYVIKSAPKKVTSANPVRKQSFKISELREAITAAGLPAEAQSAIQMICLQKKITAAQACEYFKKINAELDGL